MLKIYNSLTQQKEEFTPLEKGVVKMYVCGPTVYDEPHIGHLRSAYVFEFIRNYLKHSNYKVTFVRNVTDIDDKIIEKAKNSKSENLRQEVRQISKLYFDLYKKDLQRLSISDPDIEPRATDNIGHMMEMIQRLLQAGHAYEVQGNVYFNVGSFPDYGKLSNQNLSQLLEGGDVETGINKRNPLDFALWKTAKDEEPSWDAPWGKGRPGWHIECSAMCYAHLGRTFDIHGGGRDLIFPHHENEIAQSRCFSGVPFAKLWMHHGLITVDNKKMSKSLKNFVTLSSLEKTAPWAVEDLKFLFLGTHYRMPLDFSDKALAQARSIREKFHIFFEDATKHEGAVPDDGNMKKFDQGIREALDDDFNTPLALAALQELIRYARKSGDSAVMYGVAQELRKIWKIFALGIPGAQTQGGAEVQNLISQREEAKKKKDFKTADAIRAKLTSMNVSISDNPDGTTSWRLN